MPSVLFIGDRATPAIDAAGYPFLVSALMTSSYYDRGLQFSVVSEKGLRIADVLDRFDELILPANPDIISICIGMEDILPSDGSYPTPLVKYSDGYLALLERLKEAFPYIKPIMIEPFLLPGEATEENFNAIFTAATNYQQAVRTLSRDCGTTFIPAQSALARASKLRAPEYWLSDGLLPTDAGHGLLAGEWINAAKELIL